MQRDAVDCGPTCLKMIATYFGRNYSIQKLRALCQTTSMGVTLLDISEAAEQIGLHSLGAKTDTQELKTAPLPCILHWKQKHFIVLYKVKNNSYYIADPLSGKVKLSEKEFLSNWTVSNTEESGIGLFLRATPKFYQFEQDGPKKLNWSFITKYLFSYKRLLLQIVLALAIGTALQLIAPFLTQSIVDVGIGTGNLNFIQLILIAQVMIFIGSTSVDFIRSWILLHISTRLNIAILTDLLIKLMKLPLSFFDTKTPGDIMQRINDEKRIESFLTGSSLNIAFSIFNFVVFTFVIAFYNFLIFVVFGLSTILYVGWLLLFLRKRKELDYKRFVNNSKSQDNIIELIYGMQEIKLHNAEIRKRWSWEHIQARLFIFNVRSLALTQYQQAGAVFINQGKNIFITYLSAKAVIDGNLTVGAMMAIQYIIGQLSGPVEQLLSFLQNYQDASISVERLNEIHELEDEEPERKDYIHTLPADHSITLKNLTFRYPGAGNEPVLDNINLSIPAGKTTAIVGMSGSGKTTILKLLLRFYEPEAGAIYIGDTRLDEIRHKVWRAKCSIVMQDGYLFADTVEHNIAVSEQSADPEKLDSAIHIANLHDVVHALPYGLNSKIGSGENGLSQGQKQRLLIARAVYKNPDFIFFDEATNALDANNEKVIVENLNAFLKGKTVIVVAHRLSTVKNADNIIVLHQGRIKEQGTHQQLSQLRGEYFNLIKNQLEFGL